MDPKIWRKRGRMTDNTQLAWVPIDGTSWIVAEEDKERLLAVVRLR